MRPSPPPTHARKYDAAIAVGRVNHYFKAKGKKVLLPTPGRIGTSSPELGLPVNFAELVGCTAVCEVSDDRAGYRPELSYGSHIFQDLVEAEILYGAVWNNEKALIYRPEALNGLPNLFPEICPNGPMLAGMIRAAETPGLKLWQDAVSGRAVCGWE